MRWLPSLMLPLALLAGGPVAAQEPPKEVKVALLTPLTGAWSRQGQLMRMGAELAIEDINVQGGIRSLGGAKMKLVLADAGDTTERAKNAAQRLVAEERDLVAGTGAWLSSFTLAVTEVTERAGLPWLTLSFADQITDRGFKTVFQTSAIAKVIAEQSMPEVLNLAERSTGTRPKTVAILADSTAVAQAFVKPLREGGFNNLNVKIVVDETYTGPITDATSMVQKVRSARPDFLLLYSATIGDAKLLFEKLNEFGLGKGRVPVIAPGAHLGAPEMLQNVGPELMENVIFIAANWPSKKQTDILQGLEKRSGEPWMSQDILSTYGDMWIIKDAVERAASTDRAKVLEAMRTTDTTGGPARYFLGGRVHFDEKGRRSDAPVALIQWQKSKPVLVSPAEDATSAAIWPKK